jgi:hypothetical protein
MALRQHVPELNTIRDTFYLRATGCIRLAWGKSGAGRPGKQTYENTSESTG